MSWPVPTLQNLHTISPESDNVWPKRRNLATYMRGSLTVYLDALRNGQGWTYAVTALLALCIFSLFFRSTSSLDTQPAPVAMEPVEPTSLNMISTPLNDHVIRVKPDPAVTAKQFWTLMANDKTARSELRTVFKAVPFPTYRFECPPVTDTSFSSSPFEFVIVDYPALHGVAPEASTFDLSPGCSDDTAVAFPNLGRDAMLVVPCPTSAKSDYSSIGTFMRHAGSKEQDRLFQVVSCRLLGFSVPCLDRNSNI